MTNVNSLVNKWSQTQFHYPNTKKEVLTQESLNNSETKCQLRDDTAHSKVKFENMVQGAIGK